MLIILLILSVVFAVFAYKFYCNYRDEKNESDKLNKLYEVEKGRFQKLSNKYSAIIAIDEEVESRKSELQTLEGLIKTAQENYDTNNEKYTKLLDAKNLLEEDIEILEFGLYKPHFNFDTSESYMDAIKENYEKQKKLIKEEKAVVSNTDWTVNNSKTAGKQMIKKSSKLMLRAFNGECDALIVKTRWNNFFKMKERMKKAFEAINKLGETNSIYIDNKYLELKKEQLYLTYEYEEKKYEEKEEQARLREQIREEQIAQKEYEKAQKEAEDAEQHYSKALEQARKEMSTAKEDEINQYLQEIETLEQELKTAQENKQRAISQAQLTKAGHIYVISNIGSFGENVYKIGMTRRLEPLDRVRELGDASVPFRFDVHALIYSENAPELENKLHNIFRNKSVNLVNYKKEFFNVTLEEIQKAVDENYGHIEFTKLAEAKDYRETLEILKAQNFVAAE